MKKDINDDNLTPFKTDGCSMFPDHKWRECCVTHDKAYWKGGAKTQRKEADKKLYECVKEKGFPIVAKIMYFGVRIAGVSYLPTPWRWGFGIIKKEKEV